METEKKELQINGKIYVEKSSITKNHEGELKIVILQRGWVMVGKFERNEKNCKLYNASVIRIWGTTQGLGQLANEGPLPDTILDPCHGVVEFDYLTMVASISCNEEKWPAL